MSTFTKEYDGIAGAIHPDRIPAFLNDVKEKYSHKDKIIQTELAFDD